MVALRGMFRQFAELKRLWNISVIDFVSNEGNSSFSEYLTSSPLSSDQLSLAAAVRCFTDSY